MNKIPQPVNANERLLYGINIRLEAVIEQLSSIVEHLAKQDGVAVTSNEVKEEVKPKAKPTRKGSKKAEV